MLKIKKYMLIKWGLGFLITLTILLIFDKWKLYKEEKPPTPEISVEGREAPLVLYDYVWNGTEITNKLTQSSLLNATESLEPLSINPYSELEVSFSEKPDKLSISRWEPGIEKGTNEQEKSSYYISNRIGTGFYIVRAEWDEGKATYITKLKTEKIVSYQELLSPKESGYTVRGFDSQSASISEIYPDYLNANIGGGFISGELEYLKRAYPELNLNKLPTYFVFEQEKVIYSTHSQQQLKSYLDKLKPKIDNR
ncbi:hypothetical protein ACFRCQ_25940 [Cytobacillus firmus]|uniref:hypothetical protein n=1 Tax=Cytobacillus firmus TaxID=1399 RepID=UPI0036858D9B